MLANRTVTDTSFLLAKLDGDRHRPIVALVLAKDTDAWRAVRTLE